MYRDVRPYVTMTQWNWLILHDLWLSYVMERLRYENLTWWNSYDILSDVFCYDVLHLVALPFHNIQYDLYAISSYDIYLVKKNA